MGEKGRVLVVDDDAGICDMLRDVFELENFAVAVANDGFQAIDIAKEQPFDVVLLDIKMPGMSGMEALKHLKTIIPHTPVIMLSAFAFEDIIRESFGQGAFAALSKPIDFETLFSTIAKACGRGGLVLVADDDETTCRMIQKNIESRGFQVEVVRDGQQAVDRTREARYDVIILDMKMPVMNGFEAYLAIRKIRPDACVVFISGYLEEISELVDDAVHKGAYICMGKPVDFDKLFEILDEVRSKEQ